MNVDDHFDPKKYIVNHIVSVNLANENGKNTPKFINR